MAYKRVTVFERRYIRIWSQGGYGKREIARRVFLLSFTISCCAVVYFFAGQFPHVLVFYRGMKAPKPQRSRGRSISGRSSAIEIRVVTKREEQKRFDEILGREHYIGKAKSVGDFLRQVAVRDEKWIGLLVWGPACYSLRDRDEWIGWSPTLRAERQKLVTQNRRFLLLSKRGRNPNLASQVLGASVRTLPEQWEARFGYRPVLAETFVDIEQYEGTCYRAAGWEPIGISKGFGRHRADFFVRNDRPKKLWVKRLIPDARGVLCAGALPAAQQKGGRSSAHGVLPFKVKQCRSLMEALQKVPDPRAQNTQFRIGSVLAIVAMAILSGHREIAAIQRFGWRLKQPQRAKLSLPFKRGTRVRKIPSYNVYYEVLSRLDLDAFARILGEWLQAQAGTLPASLAMDGKMVRETVGVLSLVDHDTGVPQTMTRISKKEGEGKRCEMKSAATVIKDCSVLDGKLITADALHCQKETAQDICEKGGDYLIQVKGNRKKLHRHAKKTMASASPLLSTQNPDTDASTNEASTSSPSNP